MDKNLEQKSIIKTGLYSSKQLLISTIIGGPAIAGFIIGCNLWSRKRPWVAIIPAFLGVPLGFILILPVFLIAHYIRSYSLRQVIGISLLFLFQAGFAFLLNWYLKKKDKTSIFNFPEFNEKIHHRRMFFPIIIISIIYFITYLAFSFYTWAVLAFYLFPHFYAYIHIYKTFGNEKIARPFLWSIVLLACLLPFATTTGEISFVIFSKANLFYTYLHLLIGYYVIFVFYSTLFILGLNILLLINWIIGLLSIKTLTNRIAVLVTMLIAISFALMITIIGSYINNHPVVNKYSITLPKKSTTLNTLNIICVSDLHLKTVTSIKFLKKMVYEIIGAKPDVIVLPGDIVETYGNTSKERLNEFLEILKDIKTKYGIYAIKGNHDYPGDMADKVDFYKCLGITMLKDSLLEVDNKFCIIGLNFRENHAKRPIDSLLQYRTKNLPIILLDHAPYCLEGAIKNKIDVQFSGHTHYGQLWPLNYITKAVYEIAWGYKKVKSTNIFVSCGIQDGLLPGRQDVSIPVRIGSVAEIMRVEIEFK